MWLFDFIFGCRKQKGGAINIDEDECLDEGEDDLIWDNDCAQDSENSLGEDMELIEESISGYLKPRFLVDKRDGSRIEFMSADECLRTVTADDIDWESLSFLDDSCKRVARSLDAHYPTHIMNYHNGVALVCWQLNPDGMYYMDADGFGMSDDEEVTIYGIIDRRGRVVSKFRYVNHDWKQVEQMKKEAENI